VTRPTSSEHIQYEAVRCIKAFMDNKVSVFVDVLRPTRLSLGSMLSFAVNVHSKSWHSV
jgi:hypothetical protein